MKWSWRVTAGQQIRLAVIAALLSSTAFAAWPLPKDAPASDYADAGNWPNDPGYAESYWELSFTPPGVAASEPVGNGFDRAWSVTRGQPSTVIAVIGGAVSFADRDLVNRWALSRGELPPPEDAQGNVSTGADPHDRNADGRFNVQDFTSATGAALPTPANVVDPRLASRPDKGDVNGNGLIDPEDLIAVFANGLDEDSNGAADDICGFDVEFGARDPSSPSADGGFDQTGLSALVSAQANNGLGGIGACPDCSVLPLRVGAQDVVDPLAVASAIRLAANSGAKVIIVGVQTFGQSPLLESAAADALAKGALVIAAPAPRSGVRTDSPADEPNILRSNALGPTSELWHAATTFHSPQRGCGESALAGIGVVSPDCTASAAVLGGAAGLLFSRATQLGVSL
ncbi:MAG: hypothetical protein ACJ790_14720, partial [Myxococcaceae bacterium]